MNRSLRVLAFVDYYLPGYRGVGPAHSVSRLIQKLSEEFDFSVFTRDHDLGDPSPFSSVPSGRWMDSGGVSLFYAKPSQLTTREIWKVIRQVNPQVIYLNSYFSRFTRSVLLLKRLGYLKEPALLIAPRGEFSRGALAIKSLKKRLYLAAATATRLHHAVTWQVSSVHELADTVAVISGDPDYFIKAPDMLLPERSFEPAVKPEKRVGEADFAFLARVAPIKNLLFAIERLGEVSGTAKFTIYGPAEDRAYWAQCEAALHRLPANVQWQFAGAVPTEQVVGRLSGHQFLLYPTQGENFGHVIAEGLLAGCPVLLSDRTPWQDLDRYHAGWVSPLEDLGAWRTGLQEAVDMGSEQYQTMSVSARRYIENLMDSRDDLELNRKMFHVAVANHFRKAA